AIFIAKRKNLSYEREGLSNFIPENVSQVKLAVKLQKLLSPHLYSQYLKQKKWKEDDEMNEQIRLNKFLTENEISSETFTNGIYFIEHKQGNGAFPQNEQTLYIHYKAGFLDGRFLDDSYFLGRPLE